ncbi:MULTISPECIES: hypothetical protein [unclassified Acinetobacter]|uniref:hypothetical protein n=1 Tax=unclassified Acinetobacter TaxID=196816 RepID=UPI0018AB4631|nr:MULTISPECIES: hypothetical protein [unclassified Acinetobacter]MBJ9952081.1 hypothetical protein [Acinetobacter baumannii]
MNRQILADKFGITAHHQSPIFSIEFGRFSAKWSKAMCLELAKIFLEKISWLLSKWQWNVV